MIIFRTFLEFSSTIGFSRGLKCSLTSISVMPSLILSVLFIMTVVVPLSAFLIFISEFSLSCLIASRSDLGMLGLGFVISISESLFLSPQDIPQDIPVFKDSPF